MRHKSHTNTRKSPPMERMLNDERDKKQCSLPPAVRRRHAHGVVRLHDYAQCRCITRGVAFATSLPFCCNRALRHNTGDALVCCAALRSANGGTQLVNITLSLGSQAFQRQLASTLANRGMLSRALSFGLDL